jgi:hypothetical protein
LRRRGALKACRQEIAPAAFLRATMAATNKYLARSSKSRAAVSATNRRATARRSFSQAAKTRCVRAALPPHLITRTGDRGGVIAPAIVARRRGHYDGMNEQKVGPK